MSKIKKQKITSELRFPEFKNTGEWEMNTVDNLCDVFRGSTFSKADLNQNGKNYCIHYGELFTKYTEVITHVFSKTNKKDGFKSKIGDVLMPSSDVTPNGLAKASAIILDNVILGGDMNILRPKIQLNSIFLSYVLNHSKGEVIKLVSGTTVKHIYPSQIATCQIYIIDNKLEQQKIASCLHSLDELINAHNQKLELLKDHKKGLMQNLFPHKGKQIPNFRFPEFKNDGAWIGKKLGEISENFDSRRIPITSTEREKGNIPYYGASGVIDYVKDYIFDEILLCISEDGANLIDRNYPIAFTITGKTWVNNHAHVLKFENYYTQILVEEYINYINIEGFLTGMAQPKLNRGKLDIIPIPLPKNPKEQQCIASCLSAVNELITAQTQKREQLKLHKKGLMQGLFPKIEN